MYRMLSRNLLSILLLFSVLAGCSARNTPAPVVESNSTVAVGSKVKAEIKSDSYRVKKGETLYSIAFRANSDVRSIALLNNLSPPYRIFPGQVLQINKKLTKASSGKGSSQTSTKSSGTTSQESHNKAIATDKKAEYGDKTSGQKAHKNVPQQAKSFSQKIRRWQWPAKGKLVATFSTAPKGNKGIDIAGRRGDSVRTAADGTVVYAGSALRGYGNLVIIKHNDDYLSAYAHNDRILVKEQQSVKSGDVIAKMGDSDAKRVMLHFEVRFRGKSVNPLKYLPKK